MPHLICLPPYKVPASAGTTVSLLHMNGDGSAAIGTTTFNLRNGAGMSNTIKKFGTYSLDMYHGNAGSYCDMVNTAPLTFPADFSIEVFAYFVSGAARQALFQLNQTLGLTLLVTPDIGRIEIGQLDRYAAGTRIIDTTSAIIPLATWHYFGIARVGSTVSVWLNGSQVATGTYAGSMGSDIYGTVGSMGGLLDGTRILGYLDEFRATRGASRDLSVIPTAEFTS